MSRQRLEGINHVAVIGAGVSGVSTAVHLRRAGLQVTVYERSGHVGGVWKFDERLASEPEYPSTRPSVGDSVDFEALQRSQAVIGERRRQRRDSPLAEANVDDLLKQHRERETESTTDAIEGGSDLEVLFAPPGPAYSSLKNNVSTIEMQLSYQQWRPETAEFVPHHVLADYIHDAAEAHGVLEAVSFHTRVDSLKKVNDQWEVETSHLHIDANAGEGWDIQTSTKLFDAVVLATGNYHACHVPNIPGLAEWKHRYPERIFHSKRYRRPEQFRDKTVLLIGSGVSSTDIARDLGPVARTIFQSCRGGAYDIPSHLLPDNAARVSGIASFEPLSSHSDSRNEGPIPGHITLTSGDALCGIDYVIVCTGYHMSFPFLRNLHNDAITSTEATDDEHVLVTDGQQTHNLHKDIWYIPDPTLACVGVPYHTATFSLFEFQAQAVATVFAGRAGLPTRQEMRREYLDRVERKGPGRPFHSLKDYGKELEYVRELVALANEQTAGNDVSVMTGHTQVFLEAYERRRERSKLLFGKTRDPEFDQRVLAAVQGC